MTPRVESLIVLLLACASAALVLFRVPPPQAVSPHESGSIARIDARVADGAASKGWVPVRERIVDEGQRGREWGAPLAEPPIYPLILTAFVRRALPDLEWLRRPPAERAVTVTPDPATRTRAREVAEVAPPAFAALLALFAVLAGAAVARALGRSDSGAPARSGAVLAGAGLAGVGAALFPELIAAAARWSTDGHVVFAAALSCAALFVTLHALDDARIQRPFTSALRGGGVGLALGLAVGAYLPAMAVLIGIQVGLAARLFLRYLTPSGKLRAARALPVFATSVHKVALLVLLPTTIETAVPPLEPLGAAHLSWLHFGWIGAGWLLFAPFALTPRLVSGRPFLAVLPALVLWGILLSGASLSAAAETVLAAAPTPAGAPPLVVWIMGPTALLLLLFACRRVPAMGVASGCLLGSTLVALAVPGGAPMFAVAFPACLPVFLPRRAMQRA